MVNYFIHVGMPRAASTFFQREVFSKLAGWGYFGPETTQYHPDFQKLMYQDDSLFDNTALPGLIRNSTHNNIILSNELFVGQSIFMASTNRTRNSKRLQKWFPNASVFIVLRNQSDLLRSLYSISVYDFNNLKPEGFIRFPDDTDISHPADKDLSLYRTYLPVEHAENYLYEPMIRMYKSVFKNVKIFLFEDLIEDCKGFLTRLNEELQGDIDIDETYRKFQDQKVNSSLSEGKLNSMRNWNKFSPLLTDYSLGNRLYKKGKQLIEHNYPKGNALKFSAELQKKIKEYYRENNAILLKENPETGINRHFDKYF